MKFIFTCGGTAGHINPALAVALRLKEDLPSTEFLFIGADGMMEMDLIPREGYEIRGLHITNISRERSFKGLAHNIDTIKNVISSTREAKRIISEFKPDVVIGTGGYVCYPVISAAHQLGIPTVIHESNAGPGLTTKMLSKKVDKILVGVEGCAHQYSNPDKVVVTGTPVRGAFSLYTKESAREELGIDANITMVLSIWGSLGAQYMNDTVVDMIPLLGDIQNLMFVHATGKRYYESFIRELDEKCPDYKAKGVDIYEYIHDMPRLMSAADLIICRAGASTLSELCFMGKPAILIPSPNVTDNHQEKNARVLEAIGGAKVILENEISPQRLHDDIKSLISDSDTLDEMAANMRKMAFYNSAEQIANEIMALTGR